MTRPPLACLPHWIGGQNVASRSARYGDVTNPATGEVIRHVPLANAADVDAAVGAAPAAWPDWRAAPPLRRARILMRFRELMDAHKKDLARDRHRGARQDARRRRGLGHARHRGDRVRDRHPAPAEGRVQRERRHRRRQLVAAPAGRRVRRHHAVQLPGDGAAVDVPGGDRLRQHVRAEALGARSVAGAAHGRAAARGGAARRRVQRRPRRQGGGRRAARASGRQGDLVRRLDADRAVHLRDRRAPRQARAGAGRRQEPRGRAARRRPRLRDRGDHRRRATARPASAAWRSRRSSRSATSATRWCERLAARARAVTSRSRRRARTSRWGR